MFAWGSNAYFTQWPATYLMAFMSFLVDILPLSGKSETTIEISDCSTELIPALRMLLIRGVFSVFHTLFLHFGSVLVK